MKTYADGMKEGYELGLKVGKFIGLLECLPSLIECQAVEQGGS